MKLSSYFLMLSFVCWLCFCFYVGFNYVDAGVEVRPCVDADGGVFTDEFCEYRTTKFVGNGYLADFLVLCVFVLLVLGVMFLEV